VQAIHPVVCNVHHVAGLSQALAQVLGQLDFVFDEQNFHAAILEESGLFVVYEFVIWLLAPCRTRFLKYHPMSKGIAPANRRGLT
jgi:hypothetical protein